MSSFITQKTGFLSHANDDRRNVQRFRELLGPRLAIRNDYHLELWTDDDIGVGTEWDSVIKAAMDKADFALLVLSPCFFASPYITATEIVSLLRHPTCKLIPVGLEHVDFTTTRLYGLEDFQVFLHREPNWVQSKFFNDVTAKYRGRFCDVLLSQLAKRFEESI